MGRAPLPSGSPLPAGAGIPPMPGARGGLPSQLAGRKDVAEQRTLVVGRGISVQAPCRMRNALLWKAPWNPA